MRIIAGEAKNKIIKTRKGYDTRPTLESIKESLFSIISKRLVNSTFLDLFSGSGAIALEALSRGAKKAILIEKDPEALKFIIENINNLNFQDRARAYKNDVLTAIKILGKKNESFDIIFMDPPYKIEISSLVLSEIYKHNLLKDNGIIICEHHVFEKLPPTIGGFIKTDERKYGKKTVTFYNFNTDL